MKAREYCCCAIPIVNAGIYAALLEQFALGITAGTLSVATQSSTSQRAKPNNIFPRPFIETHFPVVVGAATPGVAKWVFAIICYIGAAIQVFGCIAVSKVSKSPPRRGSAAHDSV